MFMSASTILTKNCRAARQLLNGDCHNVDWISEDCRFVSVITQTAIDNCNMLIAIYTVLPQIHHCDYH